MISCAGSASFPDPGRHKDIAYVDLPPGIEVKESGWRLSGMQKLPEEVTSLVTCGRKDNHSAECMFVGTSPHGYIYKIGDPGSHAQSRKLIARGISDSPDHGTCSVNGLAIRDMDYDGFPELLAWTSQIQPMGRPRFYMWSLLPLPELRGVARPKISSSWSHGLGLLDRPEIGRVTAVVAYCGNGEVVEFDIAEDRDHQGFVTESLAWKQVAQLPVSGESVQTADADNDGEVDIVIAAGFGFEAAGIHICSSPSVGAPLHTKFIINEDRRFGNVRFLVGPTRSDGLQDMIAWWCVGLSDGASEVIRYRLGPEGIRERKLLRSGDSAQLWPRDGQMCLADLNDDGRSEVWFTTGSGYLWRYDSEKESDGSGGLTNVLKSEIGLGPITSFSSRDIKAPCVVFGCGPYLLHLTSDTTPAKLK